MPSLKIWCTSGILGARAHPIGVGHATCPGLYYKYTDYFSTTFLTILLAWNFTSMPNQSNKLHFWYMKMRTVSYAAGGKYMSKWMNFECVWEIWSLEKFKWNGIMLMFSGYLKRSMDASTLFTKPNFLKDYSTSV